MIKTTQSNNDPQVCEFPFKARTPAKLYQLKTAPYLTKSTIKLSCTLFLRSLLIIVDYQDVFLPK